MKKVLRMKPRSSSRFFLFGLLPALILGFTSCTNYYDYDTSGRDGYPGKAYLALHWDLDEPDFIDAGTSDIPPVFEWGAYYLTNPGIYTFYYDGEDWDGYRWNEYAWEVDFEIWINPGEQGSKYYDGLDGMNNFFSIVCSPYGPDVLYDGKSYKKTTASESKIPDVGTKITRELTSNDLQMKVTYKRVDKRN